MVRESLAMAPKNGVVGVTGGFHVVWENFDGSIWGLYTSSQRRFWAEVLGPIVRWRMAHIQAAG